ncbi:hypothetical protein FH972_021721 [Carpinus fangiana]|uniref:Enoyl reductase (ER) domain-containing protein n=1 Tax=Carpinus fangiana TaxID=176857 RepID=A0A5N6KQ46_9ROSI|nr:hypothetical protein FH972_021721 [Carpinus fangiana]
MAQKTQAIVAREPSAPGPNWTLEDVEVGPPARGQILVRMVASGICHTDIVLTSVPEGVLDIHYPKIVGHEGSGIVEAVGDGVTSVQPGDPVLLSFDSCRACAECTTAHSAYCDEFPVRNYGGSQQSWTIDKEKAWGSFFGQSSFSRLSVVSEASVVNAKDLIKSDDELKLFAPLGCGLQTGAGAITNIADAGANDVVLVLGLGAVGLAAIMTSKIRKCKTIIAVDRTDSRLQLAKTVGATATLNTTQEGFDLNQVIRKIAPAGASVVIETTGVPFLIEAALTGTARRGKFIMIGVTPLDFDVKMNGIAMINVRLPAIFSRSLQAVH